MSISLFTFAKNLKNKERMDKITSVLLSGCESTLVEEQIGELQLECLKARKSLFFDPILGFNHNMGGVRTGASLQDATDSVNAITNGFITFHFVSHRRLWFEIKGVDKRYTLHSANEYNFNTKESAAINPYNKIAEAVLKALKERCEMERTYQLLIAA